MALGRYLLYVSYIGRPFCGAQRQKSAKVFPRADDPDTIQGRLEMGLKLLNPCNDPAVFLSSRTDAGVNAMSSTVHVDLLRRDNLVYEPKTLTICLNKYFTKEDVPIRILKTFLVPDTFHCRHSAISRTYLYRLASVDSDASNIAPHLKLVPIEELDRSLFVCTNTFNVEQAKRAAKEFEGYHDFRTFMGRGSSEPDKMTRRLVQRVEVCEGRNLLYSDKYSYPSICGDIRAEYKYYDVYVQATGFLYRQVRRMVTALIGVAQGKISTRDIKLMLQVPSQHSWVNSLKQVPARGLYLCDVEYTEADRATFKETA